MTNNEPLNRWDERIRECNGNVGEPEMTTYRLMRAKRVFEGLSLDAQETLLGIEAPILQSSATTEQIEVIK